LPFLPRKATQGKLSVRLSVCLSGTLRYRDHTHWKSAKIISRLISLAISLSADSCTCTSMTAVSHHLGTANSAIRSADPENPSLEINMVWIGCTSFFARYSPLNYTVTLKLGFGVTVTQGHRRRHYSMEHMRLYIRLP